MDNWLIWGECIYQRINAKMSYPPHKLPKFSSVYCSGGSHQSMHVCMCVESLKNRLGYNPEEGMEFWII